MAGKTSNESGKTLSSSGKRCRLKLQDKINILDWVKRTGKSQSAAAQHFQTTFPGISQPLVSTLLRDEAALRARAANPAKHTQYRSNEVQLPDLEERLELWVTKILSDGRVRLSGALIVAQANKILNDMDIPLDKRPKLSSGWLTRFKSRQGLKSFKLHGEAASADLVDVKSEQDRLQLLLKDWPQQDIFNMDETASLYK